MAVIPPNSVTNYQLKQSTEVSEEERRRDERNSARGKKKETKNKSSKEPFNAQTVEEVHHDAEAVELTSQIIDSSKVIELLSHRPKAQLFKQLAFKAQLKSETAQKISQIPDTKKLNKAL